MSWLKVKAAMDASSTGAGPGCAVSTPDLVPATHLIGYLRLVPPSGGFILAGGLDRAALHAVLAEDPYAVGGVAE